MSCPTREPHHQRAIAYCNYGQAFIPTSVLTPLWTPKGPFISDVGNVFTIFDVYPSLPFGSFFTTICWQIWQIFDPSPPKNCQRLKWMVPKCKKLQYISDTIDQDSYQKHSLTQWSETDQENKVMPGISISIICFECERNAGPFSLFNSS